MRLLIIDDDKEGAEFLKHNLKSEGFIVETEHTGQQGLSLAKINDFDLIVLDYSLPDTTGFEVCANFRKSNKTTPVLMLSANKQTSNKVEVLNCGADDYLTKPYSFKELLARIKAILRRPKSFQDKVEKIYDLKIDYDKNLVKKNGQNIHLTPKEFSILNLLIRNKGSVVSRAQILESAWDVNADPFSNTVESHILSLRKKIDKDKKIIKTISGRGYIIDDD
ncbi:MAG: response regulator [Candidatus Moranbacteria bacterium]|nr:response regulator [Candidatus Moranbacteria bacterium]